MKAGGTISTSNCCTLAFFLLCRLSLFTQLFLLMTGNSGNCLHSANIIFNVESCGNGPQKAQNQTEQGSLLKEIKID